MHKLSTIVKVLTGLKLKAGYRRSAVGQPLARMSAIVLCQDCKCIYKDINPIIHENINFNGERPVGTTLTVIVSILLRPRPQRKSLNTPCFISLPVEMASPALSMASPASSVASTWTRPVRSTDLWPTDTRRKNDFFSWKK